MIKTRNNNTMTEAAYYGLIRSALRKTFQYWKPMQVALKNASRKIHISGKKYKTEYKCAHCNKWFTRDKVQIDHIVECGSLRSLEDIAPFVERLTIEDPNAYQILCKDNCHLNKTKKARVKAAS